jgi:hypothetical protein
MSWVLLLERLQCASETNIEKVALIPPGGGRSFVGERDGAAAGIATTFADPMVADFIAFDEFGEKRGDHPVAAGGAAGGRSAGGGGELCHIAPKLHRIGLLHIVQYLMGDG